MARPTRKSGSIGRLLDDLMDSDRIAAILADKCVRCGALAQAFRDDISHREFEISGFCQECQNLVFDQEEQ
jgi:hypothetical protein